MRGARLARPAERSMAAAALLVGLLAARGTVQAQQATVTMRADKSVVHTGEPFRLEVRVELEDGDLDELQLPDLSEFEILGQRQSRPFSFSFNLGRGASTRSSVIHTYTLRALDPGQVTFPPVRAVVGGKAFSSKGLTLEVREGSGPAPMDSQDPTQDPARAAAGEAPPVDLDPSQVDDRLFLRAVADTRTARVGQQVTVTIYLYARGGLRSAPEITKEPTADGFWTHDLFPTNRALTATQQRVNGRTYQVYALQRFAAFPLEAGQHTVGPMEVRVGGGNGSIFDLLQGGARKPITRRSQALQIEVEPLPEALDAGKPWHVGTLTARLSAEPARVAVGEAVTLRATLSGEGNLRGLRLPAPKVPGFEVLDPSIDDQLASPADRVGGARRYEWLALARKPGTHEASLGPVQVVDPETGGLRNEVALPVTLEVTGSATGSATGDAGIDYDDNMDLPMPGDASGTRGLVLGSPRTPATLEVRSAPLHESPLYWWSLALFPLAAAGAGGVSWLQRSRANRLERDSRSRLLAESTEALQRARDEGFGSAGWKHVQRAVQLGLEAAMNESVAAFTFDDLERRVARSGLPPNLGARATRLLRDAELAQYTPGAAEANALSGAIDETAAVLDELQSEASRPGVTP